MTDYKEEQSNEIEALESIYPDEFEVLETKPHHKFSVEIKSDFVPNEYGVEIDQACISLIIGYTATYPDDQPVMEIIPIENIEEEDLEELRTELVAQCEENLGMVMVFTLVSHSLEWLNTHIENIYQSAKDEEERKKKALEEAEQKRFEGTRVTMESFLSWKSKFDEEMKTKAQIEKEKEKNKKPTGRELFTTDITLNESDLAFLGEGETAEVAIDESLFEDLDDLDLDDEDDDDEWHPGMEDDESD